jgi:predicted  nucleic acid-binding Zn-ribbon protein
MKDKTLQAVLHKLEKEIQSLKNEISTKNETLNLTQKMIETLKEYGSYAEYKEKYSELSKQYEIEKERLLKLHHIFKERDDECTKLREEVNGWQDWFNSKKDIFDRLFSAAPPVNLNRTEKERDVSVLAEIGAKKKLKIRNKKKKS